MILAPVLLLCATVSFAAQVPIKTDLPFEKAAKLRATPITLVVPQEIAQMKFDKRMRLMRVTIPIGTSIAANTENALRANFAKVKLSRTLAEAETKATLEVKSGEVMPKLPKTTFGTYSSAVKLTFVYRDSIAKEEREITVTGDGGNRKHAGRVLWESGWKSTDAQQLGRATDIAMLDALDQLIAQLDTK